MIYKQQRPGRRAAPREVCATHAAALAGVESRWQHCQEEAQQVPQQPPQESQQQQPGHQGIRPPKTYWSEKCERTASVALGRKEGRTFVR